MMILFAMTWVGVGFVGDGLGVGVIGVEVGIVGRGSVVLVAVLDGTSVFF